MSRISPTLRVFCVECHQEVDYAPFTVPDDPDVVGKTAPHKNDSGHRCDGSGMLVK